MVKGADGLPPLFEGENGHILPVYNASL